MSAEESLTNLTQIHSENPRELAERLGVLARNGTAHEQTRQVSDAQATAGWARLSRVLKESF